MICLDFLYREGERHRGLVGPGLEQCRFLAVPSLTPHFTIPEFTSKAWEEAKRYGRPVLYADIASGGGTSVFVDEGDVTDLRLFPERAGYLEPGDEGVIVADIDLGYERPGRSTRYEHEKPVKPFAAASLVYRAHPVGDRYANFLGALWANPAVDLETVLDELQAKRVLLLDAGALPGARMRERRMRRMLGELGYTTDLEDLRTFTRKIVLPPELLPPELLPLNPLRQALARGAADVVFAWLREGHRDGLEVVESRLRQAARSLENLDPASWTPDGLRGLALVSEAVHEPPAPEKAAPLEGEEISVRVMLPEGLNPAMMGRQTYKDLILQFSASPGGLTWPTRGEEPEFDIEDRGRLVPGAWAFVAAIGLSEDLFLLGCQILHREGTTFALADPILADHLPPPLRIHHVSDLHVGPKTADSVDVKAQGTHGQALGQGAGAKPVRDVYLDHVSALPPHRKPHVVVISGDLAEMGDVELYRETQVWLDRLESLLAQHGHPGLADQEVGHALPRILLVGGNHDVNWKEVIGPAGARKRHLPFAQAFEKYPRPRLEEPPGSRPLAHVSYGAELGVEFLLLGSAEFGG